MDLSNSIIGKYKLIELVEPSKYKVKCLACGWIGVVTIRAIKKSVNHNTVKCTHSGGHTIKPGDVYGKYTVVKRSPSKLCNNGLLVPYYMCRCNKCNEIVNVTASTLYATKNRRINDVCRHQKSR